MAIDLIALAKNYLSPNVIQSAAARVGESSDATQKAFAGIVPTLVGALANTASTTDGAQQLLRMLDAGKYDGGLLNNVTSLFAGGTTTDGALNTGKGILNGLFGDKIGDVSNVIARFAGVRPESASSLLAPRRAARHARAWRAAYVRRHRRGWPGQLAGRAEELPARPGTARPRLHAGMVDVAGWTLESRNERSRGRLTRPRKK
jgi:hypothetical protein